MKKKLASELNFDRLNKDEYIKNFVAHCPYNWPPEQKLDSLILLVNDNLTNLIIEEVKSILVPQIQEKQTTINSAGAQNKIEEVVNKNSNIMASSTTPKEYYENVSAAVFAEIQGYMLELLGKEDTCGWLLWPS